MLEEEKTYELLKAVQKHLSFYLKSFRERLSSSLERVLRVKMKTENWDIALNEVRNPDISISRSFDFHLDMLIAVSGGQCNSGRFPGHSSCGCPILRDNYLGGFNACELPIRHMNILNSGKHADNNLGIQKFMIFPFQNKQPTRRVRFPGGGKDEQDRSAGNTQFIVL